MLWLVDNAVDVYIYNDLDLMTEYHKKATQIGGFTSNGVFFERRKVRLWLSQKNGLKKVILNLKDVFYFPSSPSNLISLALLNNSGIFYNNENETLYNIYIKKVLAKAKK